MNCVPSRGCQRNLLQHRYFSTSLKRSNTELNSPNGDKNELWIAQDDILIDPSIVQVGNGCSFLEWYDKTWKLYPMSKSLPCSDIRYF